jgi:hypothetical protein
MARATHSPTRPGGVPPKCARVWEGVLGFKRPRHRMYRVLRIVLLTGLLWQYVLHIVLIAGGSRSVCGHTLAR